MSTHKLANVAYHASSATLWHDRQAATVARQQKCQVAVTSSLAPHGRPPIQDPEFVHQTVTPQILGINQLSLPRMPKQLRIGDAKRTDTCMLWPLERSRHGCSCHHPSTCDVRHTAHRCGPQRWLGPVHQLRAVAVNVPSPTAPGAHTPLQVPIACAGCHYKPPCLHREATLASTKLRLGHTQSLPRAATLFMVLQSAGRGLPAHA